MQRRCLIGLGANVADPVAALPLAWRAVSAALRLERPRLSRVVRSAPAEAATGPRFANAVGLGYTAAAPEAVLRTLQRVEAAFGRDRAREGHHGDRPLDLDLLALGELQLEGARLTLPHPRLLQRDFVLAPLAEVAPDWRHPTAGLSAGQALAALATELRTLEAP